MRWDILDFKSISNEDLYKILQLRQRIFVIEQNCPYLDNDDLDQEALHLIGKDDSGVIVAYTRILKPGSYYTESSIGRVVVDASYRGTGLGKDLMNLSVQVCEQLYPETDIRIMAQFYLLKFYTDLGFQRQGEIFLEDDIEHIEMVYTYQA